MTITRPIANTVKASLLVLALAATLVAGNAPRPAAAADVAAAAQKPAVTSPIANKTRVQQAVTTVTQAQRGEGVIRITTRICGTAKNWQSIAAANNITPPVYLVMLGQNVSVACAAGPVAPPPPAPAQAPVAATAGDGWTHPVPGRCPSTNHGYGGGAYLAGRDGYLHQGQDFGAASGTPIHAIGTGQITSAGYHGGAGNQVIQQIGPVTVKYNHLSSFRRTGGWVVAGEVIGYVGSTGRSTGPHLHLEVWSGGRHTDPLAFLASVGVNARC